MLSLFINNALYSTDRPTCHVYSAAAYDSSKLRTELIDADIFICFALSASPSPSSFSIFLHSYSLLLAAPSLRPIQIHSGVSKFHTSFTHISNNINKGCASSA